MVEQAGERIAPRLIGELGGCAVEVRDDALDDEPVDRVVEAALDLDHVAALELGQALGDEAPEDPAQQQELGDDLARREAERLALAGVVAGDRCRAGRRRASAPASAARPRGRARR